MANLEVKSTNNTKTASIENLELNSTNDTKRVSVYRRSSHLWGLHQKKPGGLGNCLLSSNVK